MKQRKKYPVGIQTFEKIREEDFFYIDKTQYVYNLVHADGKYFFLNRPRRFGKSLLVSTFKSYFEGRKDLFKGLAIEHMEKDWTERPVLYFSLAGGKHMEKDALNRYLLYILKENENRLGIICHEPDPNIRLNKTKGIMGINIMKNATLVMPYTKDKDRLSLPELCPFII